VKRISGIVFLVAVVVAVVGAQAPTAPAPFKSVEYLVLGDATRGAGEPMVAVDPTNPKNIIVTAMGTLTELPPPPPGGMPGTQSIPRSTIAWLAVTHDGGATWKVGELPILANSTYSRCPDAVADVTKQGVFLAGCEPRETTGEQFGTSAIMASDDKGETWGPRAEMISSYGASRFAPGLKPYIKGASPWDRPYTFVDDSTGVIYGVAFGGSAVSETDPKKTRKQSYLTASTDGGRSFGTVYSWDSKEYPQSGNGLGVTAAHGVVAVVYVAGSAPAKESAMCPCYVMGLSRDQGRTFSYSVLRQLPAPPPEAEPAGPSTPGSAPTGPRTPPPIPGPARGAAGVALHHMNNVLSADPTKPGRYALLVSVSGPTPQYQVSVTEDFGKTWGAPVVAGETPDAAKYVKPAFEYSRDGVLGLMWRAFYADNSYDIWCAISRDGGRTFSRSVRVSHAKSPGSLRTKGTGNDDISDLSMDKENIHVVWGDFRTGFMGTWYGRVPFAAFEFPTGQGAGAPPPQAAVPPAAPKPFGIVGEPAGSGRTPAVAEYDPSLPSHTLFHPVKMAGTPLPLVLWGNGGCRDDGLNNGAFLREVASHGFVVIALGPPRVERGIEAPPAAPPANAAPRPAPAPAAGTIRPVDPTQPSQLIEAIDWAAAQNSKPGGRWQHLIDLRHIGVMGHSCGGLQAIVASADPRVTATMVFNSGVLNAGPASGQSGLQVTKDQLAKFHAPMAYITGGARESAQPNAADDFTRINHVPVFWAYSDIGHGGTFWSAPNGGEYGQIASRYFEWRLKADRAAAAMFEGPTCALCTDARWTVQKKGMK
jgi:dienelactone hydrolase